ncbi:TPA: DUF551 domain-containing protein [Klebsiella pneumoniae]|nr:DUF551 domain-containing protein [Klebsiella pneumoniae]
MTKSTITRERLVKIKSWREIYGAGSNVMLPAEEAEALALIALAAMDSEPVAYTEKHEISNMQATGLYLRAWPADRARNSVEGYTIPLYTTPQPISLVNSEPVAYIFKHPAGRLFWALTDESNKGQNDVMPVYASPQPAPAIPDGYVMVPKEPTEAMMLHNSGCQHHAWDDPDCAMRQTRRLIWSHMLAAAPQSPSSEPATVPGKWIPVSERMPERGDWLVTDGCDFDVQLFNGEQFIPGFVWEDKITHWMPLPAAPQEVK